MPRKSHRRRRKKAGQAPDPPRKETSAEKEQSQLQMEAQRRRLDEILQGAKTPSREFVITQLNKRRKNASRNIAND